MVNPTIIAILAFISATFMAALGYLKNKNEEDFNPEKLFATYLSAAVVAILYVLYGVDLGTGDMLVFYFIHQSGLTVILERVFKFIWRTYVAPHIPE